MSKVLTYSDSSSDGRSWTQFIFIQFLAEVVFNIVFVSLEGCNNIGNFELVYFKCYEEDL